MEKRHRKPKTQFTRDIERNKRRFMRKFYSILGDRCACRTILDRLDGALLGEYDPVTDIKYVDWRGPLLMVHIHEMIHQGWPDWSESAVETAEMFLGLSLTNQQARNLWCRIAEALRQ